MNRPGCRLPLDEIGLDEPHASQAHEAHSMERGEAIGDLGIRLACKTKVSTELEGLASSKFSVTKP
jgi:hypothetical protein